MKRFKIEVTRIDEYIIEIDETIYNEEWLANFREHFFDFFSPEDIARHLAQHQARFGSSEEFIEGFGDVTRDGKLSAFNKDEPAAGLNIVIQSEDEDIELDVIDISNIRKSK